MRRAGQLVGAPGRRLFVRCEGEGMPVLVLHGFTGCGEAMQPAARELPSQTRRIFVDLIGHGRSEVPEEIDAYRMEACVDELCSVLDALEVTRAHVLGYSMGARVALALAVHAPARVASLLLVGARAGIEDPLARDQRIEDDQRLARRILEEGVEWFVDHWMGLSLFASQRRLGRESLERARHQRLSCNPLGLAQSLRGMGAGAQPPLFAELPGLDVPALLVTGEEDERFSGIARDLEQRLPKATRVVLPRAGHAVHLENPAAFGAALRCFGSAHEILQPPSCPDGTGG